MPDDPPGRKPPLGRLKPAPDGRGKQPEKPPMLPFSGRRFLVILGLLFLLNYAVVGLIAPEEKQIRVPYSPTFIDQVQNGNVKEIASKGETISGEFKKEVTYEKEKADHFNTEVPTFANTDALSKLLQENNVTVNARPPMERGLLQTLLFSFGPTIL